MSNIPINRIVAFLGPYIAVLSGAVTDWLFVHIHFLANFHSHTQVANYVTQVAVFGVTSILVWLGHQKWLDGWQRYESGGGGMVRAAQQLEKASVTKVQETK